MKELGQAAVMPELEQLTSIQQHHFTDHMKDEFTSPVTSFGYTYSDFCYLTTVYQLQIIQY
jgi:hypothetical protein